MTADQPVTATAIKKRGMRKPKAAKKKDEETGFSHSVVTLAFGKNQYHGPLNKDSLGVRSLAGANGSYQWADGQRYEGPFLGSQIVGRGRFFWPDGSTYEGDILNGLRHGEGTYVAPDGVSKYTGQWKDGCRHGVGRLSFDLQGESYYHGQWEEGCKHGFGRQVWPSRNVYEGEWRLGRMWGTGTMTWKDGVMMEQYTGDWEDNQPTGEGTHTWHAVEPKVDSLEREMPSQQMNNCYKGQWKGGVRHGQGTFFYASGAKYSGSWEDGLKEGLGRYVNEDGQVHTGTFGADRILGCKDVLLASANRPVLNVGAEDNPVRRCINISDLEAFLPSESSSRGQGEPPNEVFNMLLRSLGELKKVYGQRRGPLRKPGADPFMLSTAQFWTLLRDLRLLRPSSSLSQLNRAVMCGPRHQEEVSPADMEDFRPLTPRQRPVVQAFEGPSLESLAQEAVGDDKLEEHSERTHEEGEWDGSPTCSRGSTPISRTRTGGQDATHDLLPESKSVEQSTEAVQASAPELHRKEERHSSKASFRHVNEAGIEPRYSKFWRKLGEDGQDALADIHSPSELMLFRHFLEAFARLSLVAFPQEKGLETQLKRLLKERLPLALSISHASVQAFAFLVDAEIQKVLGEFSPELWQLFKYHAAGEGSYGRPAWSTVKDQEAEAHEEPGATRRLRRGFGGQRRCHVRARLDVTIRVKDALLILDGAGLLLPFRPEVTDPEAAVFQTQSPSWDTDPGLERLETTRSADDSDVNAGEQSSSDDVEVSSFDFRLSYLDVLRIVLEVHHQECQSQLRWSLGKASSTSEDYVALLEFLESELTFQEFQRLLLQIAVGRVQKATSQAPLHHRLEAFMRHVFLPSLKQPYLPPAAVEVVAVEDAVEGDSVQAAVSPEKEQPEPVVDFWRGFDAEADLELVSTVAPRMWPEHYTQEVALW